mmetsp:Transcript_23205/g.59272  ORF Transcript_23205/g.59272 Transcript_23205/m.59272 type:complete len:298 (+) Transcript_23205:478-1371(+)
MTSPWPRLAATGAACRSRARASSLWWTGAWRSRCRCPTWRRRSSRRTTSCSSSTWTTRRRTSARTRWRRWRSTCPRATRTTLAARLARSRPPRCCWTRCWCTPTRARPPPTTPPPRSATCTCWRRVAGLRLRCSWATSRWAGRRRTSRSATRPSSASSSCPSPPPRTRWWLCRWTRLSARARPTTRTSCASSPPRRRRPSSWTSRPRRWPPRTKSAAASWRRPCRGPCSRCLRARCAGCRAPRSRGRAGSRTPRRTALLCAAPTRRTTATCTRWTARSSTCTSRPCSSPLTRWTAWS